MHDIIQPLIHIKDQGYTLFPLPPLEATDKDTQLISVSTEGIQISKRTRLNARVDLCKLIRRQLVRAGVISMLGVSNAGALSTTNYHHTNVYAIDTVHSATNLSDSWTALNFGPLSNDGQTWLVFEHTQCILEAPEFSA